MSFPCLLRPSSRFGRIFPAAAFLLALWATEVCSAAEASFGANLNYSLQLPANWTSTVNKEKANSLGANGPGGVTLNAFVFPSDRTPEGVMEMVTTRVTEKKPGYKFIEKGSLKTNAGRTAHLKRYQLEGKNSTEWVEYYFQLAEKEVVVLAFAFPTGTGKSFKPDIDVIFNSVKIAAASAKEDSWLSSDASPGAGPKTNTAPAAPKTSATPVTFATNCSLELPAGWTVKSSGKHVEATGPGGTSLDGFSVTSPASLDVVLGTHLGVFEKMPGYELVDTDEVSTKAGAKGKLAYYRYTGKSGPVTEIAVLIEVAKNQVVTLRFLAPSDSKKLDATFQSAVEAIFSSLKISK